MTSGWLLHNFIQDLVFSNFRGEAEKNEKRFLMKKFLYVFALTAMLAGLFAACSESGTGGDNTVTFSGTVTLQDETEHSGVTVALYEPAVLDTALQRLNQEYPGIGVTITQQTEFDHRAHTPVYSTTSAADGSWEISDAQPGTYNIVYSRDGFGRHYILNNPSGTTNPTDVTLAKATVLSGVISDNRTYNNAYLVLDDVTIAAGATLSISGNSLVELPDNGTIDIFGTLEIRGTANHFIPVISAQSGEQWRQITVETSGMLQLENVLVQQSSFGVYNKSAASRFEQTIFRDNGAGLLNFYLADTFSVTNTLFINNTLGLENIATRKLGIYDNLFYDNEAGLRIAGGNNASQTVDFVMQRNIFKNNEWGLRVNWPVATFFGLVAGKVIKNVFDNDNIMIDVGQNGQFDTNYNNFFNAKTYFVSINNATGLDTLNFMLNYWQIFQIDDIERQIKNETQEWGIVDVKNFLMVPVNINE